MSRTARLIRPVLALAGLVLWAGAGVGCRSLPAEAGPIRRLYLITTPVALNLDQVPGPEGVGVNLFGFGRRAKAVALPPGEVEFIAYDEAGILEEPPRPFRRWRFTVEELRSRRLRAAIGEGYRLLLVWAPREPLGHRLSLICRYRPAGGGPEVVSEPSTIRLGPPPR
ncbi:MAG: hypothetical protein D6766_08465 [Verrucomicrobia bacterium]|nr:MAG: hypothetical protein D6766_08465 [Verrucomicrobiota bacterium]